MGNPPGNGLHQYNQMVFSDPRLLSTILPIGDGLVISTKK
jgi:predicted O-methyltransferase YrrM